MPNVAAMIIIAISVVGITTGPIIQDTVQNVAYGIKSSDPNNTASIHQIARQISSGTQNYSVDQIEQVLQKIYVELSDALGSQKANSIFTEIKQQVGLDSHSSPLSQAITKIAANVLSNPPKLDQTIAKIATSIEKGPPPPNYLILAIARQAAILIYHPFQPIIQGAATIKEHNEPNAGTSQFGVAFSCLFDQEISNKFLVQFISYQSDSSTNRGANYSSYSNCIKPGIANVDGYNNNNFVIPVVSDIIPVETVELTLEHILLETANIGGDSLAKSAITEILNGVNDDPTGDLSHSMYQISQLEANNVNVAYKIVTAISESLAAGGNVIEIPTIVKSILNPIHEKSHPRNNDNNDNGSGDGDNSGPCDGDTNGTKGCGIYPCDNDPDGCGNPPPSPSLCNGDKCGGDNGGDNGGDS